LLSECEDIKVVGEATTLSEEIQKSAELQPDEIIFDLHMADGAKQHLFNGTKLLAMSFANDDEAAALAYKIGAAKLLDKLELANELIPAPHKCVVRKTRFAGRQPLRESSESSLDASHEDKNEHN
jgi:DNA-binding NarL/FixJ family response regulator